MIVLLDGYPRADMLARDWDYTGPGIEAGLEELGFEWMLNDAYEMAVRDGPGPDRVRVAW